MKSQSWTGRRRLDLGFVEKRQARVEANVIGWSGWK